MAIHPPITVSSPVQPLTGHLPGIGIRLVIDGRRKDVREALDQQTMAMAQAAAELFASELPTL